MNVRPLAANGSRRRRRADRAPSVTDDAIDKIRELSVSGAWGPGDRLPTDSALAAPLGLSRNWQSCHHLAAGEPGHANPARPALARPDCGRRARGHARRAPADL